MTDTQSSDHSHDQQGKRWANWRGQDHFAWAKTPGPNAMKLATVVAGFAIFPPLGVLALGYFWWNNRRGEAGPQMAGRSCGPRGRMRGYTGNQAFDDHREAVLRGLEEERRAFYDHRMAERRKRDQEAYEAFRAAQTPAAQGSRPAGETQA